MSYPDRRTVGQALHDMLCRARWGTPERTFAYTSQRLQLWDDVPAQPTLISQEGDERVTQTTRGQPVRIWEFRVVIYQDTGKDTANPRPADENDLIMSALEDLMPEDSPDGNQTLGGLVHSVRITGTILKDSGDLDGQAMMVVPIEVIVP